MLMRTTQASPTGNFQCRLCQRPIAAAEAVLLGPFPQAAQYYPEPNEFDSESGVMLEIVECPGCGLTQLMNAPVEYYKQVITAASLSPVVGEQRQALFQQLRRIFPSEITPKALEIGCAGGENLPLLGKAGFGATGIEFLPPGMAAAKQGSGILNQYLHELGTEHEHQYHLVLSFNYLEHQPDARRFLEKCSDLLTEDGRLLITVPNFDYLLTSQSAHEFVADHLVYFTAESLETALRITGFIIEDIRIINNQYDIQVIAKKRTCGAVISCKTALNELICQLNNKLIKLTDQGLKVAVWGAGHRTLALISLSNYWLIDCIIDSAKFKHHKFSPISHLRILPPETLLDTECKINVILVMVPGVYPKEVIKMIASFPAGYHAEQFPPEENSS